MKTFKYFIWLSLVFYITACAVAPEDMQRSRNKSAEAVDNNTEEDQISTRFVTKPVSGEPGLIHIERRTKEYSISMVLDASDENVYFVMDLPQEELEKHESDENNVEDPEVEEDMAEEKSEEELPLEEEPEAEEEIVEEKLEEPAPEPRDEAKASKYVLYAQTYFFEKKYARALEEIKRALEYSPNSAVAHSLKGSINYKMGDIDLARESWEEALKQDSSLDNVQKMLNELDKMEQSEQKIEDTQ